MIQRDEKWKTKKNPSKNQGSRRLLLGSRTYGQKCVLSVECRIARWELEGPTSIPAITTITSTEWVNDHFHALFNPGRRLVSGVARRGRGAESGDRGVFSSQ